MYLICVICKPAGGELYIITRGRLCGRENTFLSAISTPRIKEHLNLIVPYNTQNKYQKEKR